MLFGIGIVLLVASIVCVGVFLGKFIALLIMFNKTKNKKISVLKEKFKDEIADTRFFFILTVVIILLCVLCFYIDGKTDDNDGSSSSSKNSGMTKEEIEWYERNFGDGKAEAYKDAAKNYKGN